MKKIVPWIPVTLWMGIIFAMSSFEASVISQFNLVEFIIKKTIHVIEYSFLWYLSFNALKRTHTNNTVKQGYIALIITIVYAVTDEIHQTLVPTRHGTFRDIIIDSLGAAIFFYIYFKNRYHAHKS